jgi:hypothetical protein
MPAVARVEFWLKRGVQFQGACGRRQLAGSQRTRRTDSPKSWCNLRPVDIMLDVWSFIYDPKYHWPTSLQQAMTLKVQGARLPTKFSQNSFDGQLDSFSRPKREIVIPTATEPLADSVAKLVPYPRTAFLVPWNWDRRHPRLPYGRLPPLDLQQLRRFGT